MLRGWVAMWAIQMPWLLATLTMSIGAMAVGELLISARDRRDRCQDPALAYPEPAGEGPCGSV